jgi:hypothetical protein
MMKINYMKVIDILARSLRMEKVDMQFPDATTNNFEFIMVGPDKVKKPFKLAVKDYNLELALLKNCFTNREFEKWLSAFEYDLEQTFLQNITVHAHEDASAYIIKIAF